MESYDAILERMNNTFSELAGFHADDASDLGIRLKVLAGEIYSLLHGAEWLKNQMFPQTAQQEYLEMHAAQRGISRKGAVPSAGMLTFGRLVPLPYEVPIPKGTVCADSGESCFRFVTEENAVLAAGERMVQVSAASQEGGRASNAAAGTITFLLTPPAGVETVTNPQAFSGGTDAETDEELRKRLLKSYEVVPNGTNAEFYRSYVVQHDGIQSASVLPRANGIGTVTVYAAGKGAAPPKDLLAQIQAELNRLREINVEVTVQAAELVAVPLSLYIEPAQGCTFSAATERVLQEIQKYFDLLSVGESVILVHLGKRILDNGMVRNYRFDGGLTKDKKMDISQLAVADPVYVQLMGSVV